VDRASFPYVQWGTDFADLDDDGRMDLVAASGHLVPRILLTFAKFFRKNGLGVYGLGDHSYKQPPIVWRNEGGGRLADVTPGSGDWAALRLSARGLAAGDVDGDGRVDVAIAAVVGGIRLMKNATASRGHALEILPVAGKDARTVLGTKVLVTAGGVRQTQEFILRPSYASGSWVPLHFGLGDATAAKVEVIAPGATAATLSFDAAADRLYTLRDGKLEEKRRFLRQE
jgi:hypothetical protein